MEKQCGAMRVFSRVYRARRRPAGYRGIERVEMIASELPFVLLQSYSYKLGSCADPRFIEQLL